MDGIRGWCPDIMSDIQTNQRSQPAGVFGDTYTAALNLLPTQAQKSRFCVKALEQSYGLGKGLSQTISDQFIYKRP